MGGGSGGDEMDSDVGGVCDTDGTGSVGKGDVGGEVEVDVCVGDGMGDCGGDGVGGGVLVGVVIGVWSEDGMKFGVDV